MTTYSQQTMNWPLKKSLFLLIWHDSPLITWHNWNNFTAVLQRQE